MQIIKDEARALSVAHLRTLLYIEDNPGNLKLVELFMSRRPEIRLLTAVNGNSGLELARVSRPEVIVTDINLPDMSGFKVLEMLRADPATTRIPVVALSANIAPLNVESGQEAGFFRYLTKPIRFKEFMETLDLALVHAEKNAARRRPRNEGQTAQPGADRTPAK